MTVSKKLMCALVAVGLVCQMLFAATSAVAEVAPVDVAANAEGLPEGIDPAALKHLDDGSVVVGDAPVSPTDSSTHLKTDRERVLAHDEIDEPAVRLAPLGADYRTDATFGDIITYASQYLGWEYVWAGKDPVRDGGFDCSGFACWVFNQVANAGINSDWTNADTLYNDYCTPIAESEALPGDLVFFRGTYGTPEYISHVGIYCGDGIMINAGDPIGYDSIYTLSNVGGGYAPYFFGRLATLSSTEKSLADATVTVGDYEWTGSSVYAIPRVSYAGIPLKAGVDYTLEYRNNDRPGTAEVIVRGKGSYVGFGSASFLIYDLDDYPYRLIDLNWSEWYADNGYLDYILSNGYMRGYSYGPYFGPYDNIIRADVVVILWRLEGEPITGARAFDDVSGNEYYAAAVKWASDEGIVSGYTGTNLFGPTNSVTREELAVMLCNYAAYSDVLAGKIPEPAIEAALRAFPDAASVSPWARESIAWCVESGLMSGKSGVGGPYLDPQGTSWRASVATMLAGLHRDVIGS